MKWIINYMNYVKKYMSKKVLITGICGMDGSFMADFLLKKGYDVFGMSHKKNKNKIKNVTYINGDLSDINSLQKCLNNVKPDEIYNLGGE